MSDEPDAETRVAGAAVTGAGAVISPDFLVDLTVQAITDGTFLVLPDPEVLTMFRQKGPITSGGLRGCGGISGACGGGPSHRTTGAR